MDIDIPNLSDGVCGWLWDHGDGGIDSLCSASNGNRDSSAVAAVEVATAELLGSIALEANQSTEKVVRAALGRLVNNIPLGDMEVMDDAWVVSKNGYSQSGGSEKLGELHCCCWW